MDSSDISAVVSHNLDGVLARVRRAESRAGRPEGSVTLVGVTKTASVPAAAALLRAGCLHLGENRPEQLAERAADPLLAGAVWHLIGTYQRRKVRDTLAHVDVLHALDGTDLATTVSQRAAALGRTVTAFVQVNVSGEASKQGFSPDALDAAWPALLACAHLRIEGLMTMAPLDADDATLHRVFADTRRLRDRFATTERPLPSLSMGMSGDFEIAIAEGATHVRIGTALFADAR